MGFGKWRRSVQRGLGHDGQCQNENGQQQRDTMIHSKTPLDSRIIVQFVYVQIVKGRLQQSKFAMNHFLFQAVRDSRERDLPPFAETSSTIPNLLAHCLSVRTTSVSMTTTAISVMPRLPASSPLDFERQNRSRHCVEPAQPRLVHLSHGILNEFIFPVIRPAPATSA